MSAQNTQVLQNSQKAQAAPNSQRIKIIQSTTNPQEIQRQIQQNALATQGINSVEVEALYIQNAKKPRPHLASANFAHRTKTSLKPL